jgi:hypothetical protein
VSRSQKKPDEPSGPGRARADVEEISTVLPKSGDVLRVTKQASVQFLEPMLFRVIRMHDWPTYDGWAWLDGYQLNAAGDAVARRSIFVQLAGLTYGRVGAVPAQTRFRTTVG